MVPMMIETLYKKLSMADASISKKAVAGAAFGTGSPYHIYRWGTSVILSHMGKFEVVRCTGAGGIWDVRTLVPVISTNSVEDHKTGSIGRPLSNVEVSFENGEILCGEAA